ncbi:hypothetical protein AAVH_30238, partial [Aphelenchoides avenae]
LYDAPGPVRFIQFTSLIAAPVQVQGQLRLQQQPPVQFTPQRFAPVLSVIETRSLSSSSSQLKFVRHHRTSD